MCLPVCRVPCAYFCFVYVSVAILINVDVYEYMCEGQMLMSGIPFCHSLLLGFDEGLFFNLDIRNSTRLVDQKTPSFLTYLLPYLHSTLTPPSMVQSSNFYPCESKKQDLISKKHRKPREVGAESIIVKLEAKRPRSIQNSRNSWRNVDYTSIF